jgi:GNAT superfamily N-acetyltransferase
MTVASYNNPSEFLNRVRPFLEADEAVNLLPLGVLLRLIKGPSRQHSTEKPLMLAVEGPSGIQLAVLMTPSHRPILACSTNLHRSVITAACDYLLKAGVALPGVLGPKGATDWFAVEWATRNACEATVRMNQMIHRLDSVNKIELAAGELLQAGQAHVQLIAQWLFEFSEVSPERFTPDEARSAASDAIAENRVYLWQTDHPVSMAAWTRPTQRGIAVNWVFTQPGYRSRGYATAVVHSLSKLLLDKWYRFCTLYTDLSNSTANSIYRNIGYQPIQESIVFDFGARK